MSSFLRPEMRSWLSRWGEPTGAAIAAVIGLYIFWRGFTRYDLILQAIGAVLLLIGLAAFWAAYRRSQFARDTAGPGLVDVTERRISFMTASGGGFVDLEAMTRLEIRTSIEFGRVWVLKQTEGATLFVPLNATGGEKLFDAFSVLPGIDASVLIAAVNSDSQNRTVIWRGSPGFRRLN